MKRPGGTLLLAVVPVVLAAGCSATESARQQPRPSAAMKPVGQVASDEAPAAVVAPEPPRLPDIARHPTSEGAIAFVRHWFAIGDYAFATGVTTQLADLAAPECLPCVSLKEDVETHYASGGHFEGVAVGIDSIAAAPPDGRGTIVSLLLSEAPSRAVAADGRIVSETPRTSGVETNVFLLSTAEGWKMFDISGVTE